MKRRVAKGQPGRRGALAQGRAFNSSRRSGLRLRFGNSKEIKPEQIRAVFRAAGWMEDIARYSAVQIRKLLRQSHTVVTAWDGARLVGLASAVSDGVLCGMVQNLVVHPRYRGRGLGKQLLRELVRVMCGQRIGSLYVLGTRGRRARRFFDGAGFRLLGWNVYVFLNR